MTGAPVRAFVAIFPPAGVQAEIARALAPLRAPGDGIAWARERNLQISRFAKSAGPGRSLS
jgi:hypothetical protein